MVPKVVKRLQNPYLPEMAARGFEFEDQPWFPEHWRRWQMDYIRFAVHLLKPYKNMVAPFNKTKEPQVWVDLASGTGGPALHLLKNWKAQSSASIELIQTDRFPANETIVELDVLHDELPVAKGYTMFNAFHHFDRDQQRSILKKMSRADWALIAEPLNRSVFTFLGIFLLTGPFHFILAPFVRPFSWARLFWTYLIPVVPFVTCWDGLVSVIRTPRNGTLKNLAEQASTSEFNWEFKPLPFAFGQVALLVGKRTNV